MTTSEKVAYLKGLAEGLGLDKENKQDKLLSAIIDVLEAVALDIEDLEENALDLGDEIDAISDDLAAVEAIVYDEDECCCDGDYDDDCCCGGDHNHDDEHECCCGGDHHHEAEHECCCGHHHSEPVFYEVTCPACGKTITVDEEVLALGKIQCPSCGEMLEFDMDSIEYEDEAPVKE
ncbi:MAG: hypothetical protein KBI01_08330 [Oscillospiraceae bacterium]|nr:hypothetical protein [Oscillospiraceae bacterium]